MSGPSAEDRLFAAALDAERRLARRSGVELREEEILEQAAELLRAAFPGCLVCLRLLDPGGALSAVFATGRLRPDRRERLRWSGGLDPAADPPAPLPDAVARTAAHEPVFVEGVDGIDVLLRDGDLLLGLLDVEWSAPPGLDERERLVVAAIGRHLATVLRGARLHAEVGRLRGRVEQLLDQADAPILVLDRRQRVRVFNRSLERLTGRSRAQVAGVEFLELLPEDERPRFRQALAAAQRAQPTTHVELRLPAAGGGDPIQVSFNVAPVCGPAGEGVQEIVAVGQDLTEVRRLQRQMIHAEKLATIGQLAAGVVHEINNPLTSVSIHADYLAKQMERDGRSPQELTFINRIRDAAARILRFTQDLMNFARPAGDEPEQVDLAAVVDQSAAFCEHVIARAGVTLERRFEAAPKVYGIRGQFQQVFINLITNACHAMSAVEGERVLTLRVADHGDGRVRAEVRDTGAGIPDDVRQEIFEPFFTTKREGEGTGLGLSIVRNIIDNHQGEIQVQSEVGRGTCFTVLFYAA